VWLFVPVQWNLVCVWRQSLFVGIFVVVDFRREVQENRLLVADDFEAVPTVAGYSDRLLVVLADHELVDLALRRRIVSVVVNADLDSPLWTGEGIGLAPEMAVPRSDDAE
jgi:hypothetical protein